MRIRNNIPSLFAQRSLGKTTRALNSSIEKLSTGLRINRGGDDPAGLAVSERLRTQINGLKQASKNIQDGISLIQTAEGGIEGISDMLQRLRTLAVQSSNDILTTSDRALMQLEFNQVLTEIDRQVGAVSFNTKVLLDGRFSKVTSASNASVSMQLQVGANKSDTLSFFIFTASTKGLGVDGLKVTAVQTSTISLVDAIVNTATAAGSTELGVVNQKAAESAIALISSAITSINGLRAELGSIQNRLESTFDFVQVQTENQIAAESRIRDLDFAEEIVNFTKNQILQQTGIASLSQANIGPQVVLSLLQ
ncbi:MAG: flagellin FliC [Candidatus Lindowbacteria bacterium]|nr:flagellin FliC [Candidatus Lindowbacteria bacterium]